MKENFCASCVVTPLAMAGTKAIAKKQVKGGDDESYSFSKWKELLIGLAFVGISAGIYFYKRNCKSCKI